jgi:hypothetical protein
VEGKADLFIKEAHAGGENTKLIDLEEKSFSKTGTRQVEVEIPGGAKKKVTQTVEILFPLKTTEKMFPSRTTNSANG